MKISITGLNFVRNGLQRDFRNILHEIAQTTIEEAVKNTPIKTGYARSQWTKTVSEDNFNVQNRVPYIERLEKGHSKQAPKGITMPTVTNVQRRYR